MSTLLKILGGAAYLLFLLISLLLDFKTGKQISGNFITFTLEMLKVLPFAFILIGLFEVWVSKETVERHLGQQSGWRGFTWVILLAGTTVGGMYVAFPVAYSLFHKGAKLSIIFTYLGAAAVCRVPMAIFEANFIGLEFTAIRLMVTIPLVISTSIILGNYLEKKNFKITEGRVDILSTKRTK